MFNGVIMIQSTISPVCLIPIFQSVKTMEDKHIGVSRLAGVWKLYLNVSRARKTDHIICSKVARLFLLLVMQESMKVCEI